MIGPGPLMMLLALGAPPGPPGAYRVPVVEVRGGRPSADDIIARVAQAEERARRRDVPVRYTVRVRYVVSFGDDADRRGRRRLYESVSRVQEDPGAPRRAILLWEREAEFRGDSLVWTRRAAVDREDLDRRIERIRGIPFGARRDLFRYDVVERRRLPDRTLYRLAYAPRQDYVPLPRGEIWLDSRDFVVLLQTGSLARNVPLPMLLRSVEGFRLRRRRYGPVWLEDDFWIRLRPGLTSLGAPSRIELSVRVGEVSFPATPDSTGGVEPSWIDAPARAGGEELEPLPARFSEVAPADEAGRGDSLLSLAGRRAGMRVRRLSPVLRYDRGEGAFIGAAVALGRGASPSPSLEIEVGYASGEARPLGRCAALAGSAERAGASLTLADRIAGFGPAPPAGGSIRALMTGTDPREYADRREIVARAWTGGDGRGGDGGGVTALGPIARIRDDRAPRPRSLWSILRARPPAGPPSPVDPVRVRAIGVATRPRGVRPAPWLAIRGSAETAGRTLGGSACFRALRGAVTASPILPGGRRLRLRARLLEATRELPRQDWLRLGGEGSLRAYPGQTLAGRSGYHLGGELFLNRGIPRWEGFLAADHGRILGDGRRSGRTSVGIGLAGTVGLPGSPRVLVGIHAGVGRGDPAWAVRLAAERASAEGPEEVDEDEEQEGDPR